MVRTLFAKGARGEIIKNVQRKLTELAFDTQGVDGVFGEDTRRAVAEFQKRQDDLESTGGIDSKTYERLMGTSVPDVSDRALQLTSAFEGHGFGLAQGNYDGAGITWGIIGFTLKHDGISKIVMSVQKQNPNLVRNCFGHKTEELLEVLQASKAKRIEFGDRISLGKNKVKLAEPWRSMFLKFGELPEVQHIQCQLAAKNYFEPACETAKAFHLTTELGVALAFDIHVQNGSINERAEKMIRRELEDQPVLHERDLRVIIANAVADTAANVRFREDVRSRKLTIASGAGKVHGMSYVLSNWGLDEFPSDNPSSPSPSFP